MVDVFCIHVRKKNNEIILRSQERGMRERWRGESN
jgi:hypothetical protein